MPEIIWRSLLGRNRPNNSNSYSFGGHSVILCGPDEPLRPAVTVEQLTRLVVAVAIAATAEATQPQPVPLTPATPLPVDSEGAPLSAGGSAGRYPPAAPGPCPRFQLTPAPRHSRSCWGRSVPGGTWRTSSLFCTNRGWNTSVPSGIPLADGNVTPAPGSGCWPVNGTKQSWWCNAPPTMFPPPSTTPPSPAERRPSPNGSPPCRPEPTPHPVDGTPAPDPAHAASWTRCVC